jgi:hypothetical protein
MVEVGLPGAVWEKGHSGMGMGIGLGEMSSKCELNFCFLAGYALTCPFCDVSGHVGQNKTCGNERACYSDVRTAHRMNVVENLMLELNVNEWVKCLCGDIA